MMPLTDLLHKAERKIWLKLVSLSKKKRYYPALYRSYWHLKFNTGKGKPEAVNYFTAIPNRGAGVGHRLANWIAGYWFARQFNLTFAHTPLQKKNWDHFLGLGDGEVEVQHLLKKEGYKKVRLPLFDESKAEEILLVRKIIDSYAGKKVVFQAEQDQFYQDQYGVADDLKRKFYGSVERRKDVLIFNRENLNIAVHIRRGDIVIGQTTNDPKLTKRWQNNLYFTTVLNTIINTIKTGKPIAIYLFSQGKPDDFPEFKDFANIRFCLDMDEQNSFLHMVYADVLVTSRSSFSYKPALISNGLKICPNKFWHGYPSSREWIVTEEDGSFDTEALNSKK